MSLPLGEAQRCAAHLITLLQSGCDEIMVAGSIRRQRPIVGDIEIVAIPRFKRVHPDGAPDWTEGTALDTVLAQLVAEKTLALDTVVRRNGPKYKRLRLDGTAVDVFLAEPRNFGNILTIRTGSGAFSARIVMPRANGGCMPAGMYQRDGFLWGVNEQLVPCPTEAAFFAALGIADVPDPRQRDPALIDTLRAAQAPTAGGHGVRSQGVACMWVGAVADVRSRLARGDLWSARNLVTNLPGIQWQRWLMPEEQRQVGILKEVRDV